MPVTIKVNGTCNSLVHKGSNGVSMATLPDVCKTPSPGGPVPIPYPNVSQSITLAKGTTTVKADGMMAAIKGSEFSLSNGDNPGVVGGVKSNTFMKESTWILYSFDVKMDGKNACRLGDKKFQNHENTVDAQGEMQMIVHNQGILTRKAQECDKSVNEEWDKNHPNGPKHDNCLGDSGEKMSDGSPKKVRVKLGEEKEKCVNEKVPNSPRMTKQQAFNPKGEPIPYRSKGSGVPDFVMHQPGDLTSVFGVIDLKFPCPSGIGKEGQWSPGQLKKYRDMFPKLDDNRFVLVFP
ncbi:MAG: DUF4150 domain-containing protein [Polyangiaceae bacterium]|nr:DUF4150 domain-containing protein [Polyangiaceae bacterium]